MSDHETSWWEDTGQMTPFVGGISHPIFRSLDTGEVRPSDQLPIGALYAIKPEAGDRWPPVGADGLSVVCVTPGGEHWYIDCRASNCTMPHDDEHRCWVRHGTVGDRLTVDKNGLTCAAGAGSFFADRGRWHGFLRNGRLVQA